MMLEPPAPSTLHPPIETVPAVAPLAPASPVPTTEKYRVLTSDDGLSCEFTQDMSLSLGSGFTGRMSASANHFACIDKTGKNVEIELVSSDPHLNAGLENGKVAIRTKNLVPSTEERRG